jgi:signal transduction histidine kinase
MAKRVDTWLVRLWRRATLVQRLVLVTLVPCLLTSVLLVTLLTRQQLLSLRTMAREAAHAIAAETAAVSAEPLQRRDQADLRHIAASIGRLSHVVRLRISTPDGDVVSGERNSLNGGAPTLRVRQQVRDRDDPSRVIGTISVDVSLSRALEVQREGVFNALRWLAVSIVLALLVAWQEARWISAPLRKLAEAIQQLAASRRRVQVDVTDETEIGKLQQGFNEASLALHAHQQQLQQEVGAATRELARKNAALEAASVDKSRFLAAATHDLRQPLYALTLFSSSLAADETDPVRLERIAHVQESIASLDKLFNELLDLSRLESGAMHAEPSEFPLDQVFDEVSRNFRLLAEQHELRLVIRATPVWVRTDRTMLARILNNLVSNALRYTREGGVLVAARERGSRVRIDVWDTGPGIADVHQQRVFEEFYRIRDEHDMHGSTTRKGLGLGLATVQRLAHLIDSDVQLHSRPGRGSLFTFSIPLTTPLERAKPSQARPDGPIDLGGVRILVIDDDPAILAGIRVLLESWSCDVLVAEDSAQALDLVESWMLPPDVVICDYSLRRGRTGLEAMQALAAHYRRDGYAEAPFARLLITGETDRERLHEALEAGVPVLYKPVAPDKLRETIRDLLAMREAGEPGTGTGATD